MSEVADLELCRELYELSGWEATEYFWMEDPQNDGTDWNVYNCFEVNLPEDIPAYTLGYLLRKLPHGAYCSKGKNHYAVSSGNFRTGQYGFPITERGDTPENAAAKLAIELFKQGVLTREVEG